MRRRTPLSDDTPGRTGTKQGWNPLTLAAIAGAWTATLPNWPLWQALLALPETRTARGVLFVLAFGAMIAALTTLLLAAFGWRPLVKPAIAFSLVAAALGAHFMGTYGVVIDSTMMTNVLQTDPREVRDLLGLHLLGSLLVLGVLPAWLLWRLPLQRLTWPAQAGRNVLGALAALVLVVGLGFAFFADLSSTMRNHRSMRYLINPVNSYYALADIAVRTTAQPAGPPAVVGADARVLPRDAGALPPLLLLVVGETARADHFSLNGYPRPTNPELAALPGVVSFRNVTSCGTNTAASLPCMFSHLGREAFADRKRAHENLLDVVQRAGMAVLWLDNQSGCKGLCERVPSAQASTAAAGAPALPAGLCASDECLDGALLHGLDARLAALPAEARARGVLIVLHQMGSHGPAYSRRSPPDRKPFVPECTDTALQRCDRAALVNAYDNSIAYTDHVLAGAVAWLQRQSPHHTPALLYVSDHGESLGENNLYLHGLPYAVAPAEQKHVPMVLWQGGAAAAPACLERQRERALSHDNLFHSTLGLLGVRAAEYQPALDAFAACRMP